MIRVTQALSPHSECTILINPRYVVLAKPAGANNWGAITVVNYQSGNNVNEIYIKESLEQLRELILDYEFGVWEPIEGETNDDEDDWWRK